MSQSSILSYVDSVISTFDASQNEAEFQGLVITKKAELKEADVTGPFNIKGGGQLIIDGIPYPTLNPSTLLDSDTLVWTTDLHQDGTMVKGWTLRNLNTSALSIDMISGVNIDNAAPTGTVVVLDTTAGVAGAPGFIANKSQEFKFLDGKPAVTPEQLKLTDRLLVSVDKPGSRNPTLYKMSISSLFQFIEKSNADLSSLRGLGSNTIVNTLTTSIEIGVDDGTDTRMSGFDDGGFIMHGSLKIKNDSDGMNLFEADGVTPIKTSDITKVLNGFDITTTEGGLLKLRIGSNKTLQVDDVVRIGTNQFTLGSMSSLFVEPNTAIRFIEQPSGLAAAFTFDQHLNKSADVIFNNLALTDTFTVEGDFTANSNINLHGAIDAYDLTATSVTTDWATIENLTANNVNLFPNNKRTIDLTDPSHMRAIHINELKDTTLVSAENYSNLELKTLDQSAKFDKSSLTTNSGDNGYQVGTLNTLNATDTIIMSNMTMSAANWTPNILSTPSGFYNGTLNNVSRSQDQTQAQTAAETLIKNMEVGYMWSEEVARPYIDGGILKNLMVSDTYYNPADGHQTKRILISTATPDFALASDVKYHDAYSMEQNLQNSDSGAVLGAGHMVDYSAIVPILVAAIQKLMDRVDTLEAA